MENSSIKSTESKECCQKEGCCDKGKKFSAIGMSLILSSIIFSIAFYSSRQSGDTLSVTGSAKQTVTSDSVKWTSNFTRTVLQSDLASGYSLMNKDLLVVKKFFKDNGVDEKNLAVSPVMMENPSVYNVDKTLPQEYTLKQTIELQLTDVNKVTDLAKKVQPLIDQGVVFSNVAVEYYYSKLPDLRVNLLGQAVKDATERANKIAISGGKKAGNLKSAGVGVVQVLPVNSVNVDDYGAYDTSSIEKEVMVTVKTTFEIK